MSKTASKLFKQRIRELRTAKGWSQEEAAEKCGIGYKLYQLYELGIKDNPGLLTLEKIAHGFGLRLHELLNPNLSLKTKRTKRTGTETLGKLRKPPSPPAGRVAAETPNTPANLRPPRLRGTVPPRFG